MTKGVPMKKKWLAFLAALGAAVFFWRKKKHQEEAPAVVGETPSGETGGEGTPPGETF